MIYIGIDPGKKGAMAILKNGELLLFNREDGYDAALRLLSRESEPKICCLEDVPIMPTNGSLSLFKLGKEFGWSTGILESFKIPYEPVRPVVWKKEFDLIGKDKKASIEMAKQLFPGADLRRTSRCRVDDDNRAEALLMAEYARRKLGDNGSV